MTIIDDDSHAKPLQLTLYTKQKYVRLFQSIKQAHGLKPVSNLGVIQPAQNGIIVKFLHVTNQHRCTRVLLVTSTRKSTPFLERNATTEQNTNVYSLH